MSSGRPWLQGFRRSPANILLMQCSSNARDWTSPNAFVLRQNLDKKQLPNAAFLNWTKPVHDTGWREVGAGLRYNLPCGGSYELGPFVELSQNTRAKKKQDVVRY